MGGDGVQALWRVDGEISISGWITREGCMRRCPGLSPLLPRLVGCAMNEEEFMIALAAHFKEKSGVVPRWAHVNAF